MNDSLSWSVPLWMPSHSAWGPYGDSIFQENYQECLKNGPIGYDNIPRSLAFEAPNVEDSLISDGETTQQAIRYLHQLKDNPFFMAVGFYKPHLPYVAPQKYWDLYKKCDLKLPDNQFHPIGAPSYASAGLGLEGNKELRSYTNIPDEGELNEELKQNLLHGYLASISYVDAQIGLLLDELKSLGLEKNTIIVLLGDHGYQIGEHNMWGKKHTNYEISTHSPLIISVPGKTGGSATNSLTELIDIYPTLAELCDLTAPQNLDGISLVPLIEKPHQNIKDVAFSMYPRGARIGTSMRNNQYRFIVWESLNEDVTEYELYDHHKDPDENKNLANDPLYTSVMKELNKKFNALRH